jgi:hypothetical protein
VQVEPESGFAGCKRKIFLASKTKVVLEFKASLIAVKQTQRRKMPQGVGRQSGKGSLKIYSR